MTFTSFLKLIYKSALISVVTFALSVTLISAQRPTPDCPTVGACAPNGMECINYHGYIVPGSRPCSSTIIGKVIPPRGVATYNATDPYGNGFITFLSRGIRILTVVVGVWVMINFVLSGWILLTSVGDAGAMSKVREKLLYSVIGLAVVAGAYTIAGLIGLLFFGDAGFILYPDLYTAI